MARENQSIAVEDLKISNMARSRIAGGNRVNAAPSEFRQALQSAAMTYGAAHIEVPAHYTSQTCSECGVVHPPGIARDGESFTCPACDHRNHADINAAVNVRERARAIASARVPRNNGDPFANLDIGSRVVDFGERAVSETTEEAPRGARETRGARKARRKCA
jgi:transposase